MRTVTFTDPEGALLPMLQYLAQTNAGVGVTMSETLRRALLTHFQYPENHRISGLHLLMQALKQDVPIDPQHFAGLRFDIPENVRFQIKGDLLDSTKVGARHEGLKHHAQLLVHMVNNTERLEVIDGNRDVNKFRIASELTRAFRDKLKARARALVQSIDDWSAVTSLETLKKAWMEKVTIPMGTIKGDDGQYLLWVDGLPKAPKDDLLVALGLFDQIDYSLVTQQQLLDKLDALNMGNDVVQLQWMLSSSFGAPNAWRALKDEMAISQRTEISDAAVAAELKRWSAVDGPLTQIMQRSSIMRLELAADGKVVVHVHGYFGPQTIALARQLQAKFGGELALFDLDLQSITLNEIVAFFAKFKELAIARGEDGGFTHPELQATLQDMALPVNAGREMNGSPITTPMSELDKSVSAELAAAFTRLCAGIHHVEVGHAPQFDTAIFQSEQFGLLVTQLDNSKAGFSCMVDGVVYYADSIQSLDAGSLHTRDFSQLKEKVQSHPMLGRVIDLNMKLLEGAGVPQGLDHQAWRVVDAGRESITVFKAGGPPTFPAHHFEITWSRLAEFSASETAAKFKGDVHFENAAREREIQQLKEAANLNKKVQEHALTPKPEVSRYFKLAAELMALKATLQGQDHLPTYALTIRGRTRVTENPTGPKGIQTMLARINTALGSLDQGQFFNSSGELKQTQDSLFDNAAAVETIVNALPTINQALNDVIAECRAIAKRKIHRVAPLNLFGYRDEATKKLYEEISQGPATPRV